MTTEMFSGNVRAHVHLVRQEINCFTLKSEDRIIRDGVTLTIDHAKYPPHLKIGNGFIARNTVGGNGCAYNPKTGIMRYATTSLICPQSSDRKPFTVLNAPRNHEPQPTLLHVTVGNVSGQDGFWCGVFAENGARTVVNSPRAALIEFTADLQSAAILLGDGTVLEVIQIEKKLILLTPSPHQMARARIRAATVQLEMCDNSEYGMVKQSMILCGMIDILMHNTYRDIAIRNELIAFLSSHTMSANVLGAINAALRELGDHRCFAFSKNAGAPLVPRQRTVATKGRSPTHSTMRAAYAKLLQFVLPSAKI